MCLISIADIVCITSHPGSESCTAPVLDVHCWHCLNELPSSEWVMCSFCAWFPIADIALMNSHPGSEPCAAPVLDFYYWHCLHKISSSLWVMCNFCALFPLLTLPVWTLIQFVSHVQLLCFISIVDIACMNSHPVCESCASSCALFPLLTLPAWTLIQFVSHVQLMCLISTADITCMNYHPASELCAAHMLDFHCWHCLHKLSSREWVMSASVLDFCCWHYLHELPSRQWDMCSIYIADITYMNSHPESESCAGCVLCLHC